MPLKAKLTIILRADDTVVAESTDEALWRDVMQAVLTGDRTALRVGREEKDSASTDAQAEELGEPAHRPTSKVGKFAASMGVSEQEVRGACDPGDEAPYLHLDMQSWEALQRQMPQRGPGRVSAIQIAGTLLAFWLKYTRSDVSATQALAQQVLGTIGVAEANPTRSIKNCAWLQSRGSGAFQLNPAKVSTAQAIVRAFCSGTAIEWPS